MSQAQPAPGPAPIAPTFELTGPASDGRAAQVQGPLRGAGQSPPAVSPAGPAGAAEQVIVTVGPAVTAAEPAAEVAGAEDPEGAYGATARVATASEPTATLELGLSPEDLPGTFGDPFRILENLPGAVPMVSGLPYVYVRGAPPSGNAYYYDGIPMPQLYHLGLGPATIHPSMLGDLTFAPGVGSARYGRKLGAVFAADAPPAPSGPRSRVEARLLDANLAFAYPAGDITVMGAGRFGYPGLVAPAIGLELEFSYWDYQLRARKMLSDVDFLELVALGSRDDLSDAQAVGSSVGFDKENQRLSMEYHRLELRLERRLPRLRTGMAVRVGHDRTVIGTEAHARAQTVTTRFWVRTKFEGGHRLEVGGDINGAFGEVRELPRRAAFDEAALNAVTRNTSGAFIDGALGLTDSLRVQAGIRADVWAVGRSVTPSIDPRLKVTWTPVEALSVHAGAGLAHQPVVLAFPLPAFTDVALDRGLQEAVQSEVGTVLKLPSDFGVEFNLFAHRYRGLLLPEVFLRSVPGGEDRVKAWSYGGELFIRRQGDHAVTGFLSYTLGRARAQEPSGRWFSPEFDIRHVAHLVLQWRVTEDLRLGVGTHVRSGKPANQFTDRGVEPDYSLRLPIFVRVDGRVSYGFSLGPAAVQAYVEVLNLGLSEEAVDAECYFGSCRTVRRAAVWFPNLGVRAEF